MTGKVLHMLSSAWRATLEEQDDPILWLTQAMRASLSIDVLLTGSTVCYGLPGQDASGLCFGARRQTQAPRLPEDLGRLLVHGARVLYVAEDAAERGIEAAELLDGLEPVPRAGLPELFAGYQRVLGW
jgi:hypothetical protein